MKLLAFRSIRTQIMATTTLLILTLVIAIVFVWTSSESSLYRQQKLHEANFFSKVLNYSLYTELAEKNWSKMRLKLDLLLIENKDYVYALVSDARMENQIVAASPREFQGQYVPDIVPLRVTNAALMLSPQSKVIDTFALRDIEFGGQLRVKRGEKLLEVASDIRLISGDKIGTLRIGVSLVEVDLAIANGVKQATAVGTAGLFIGWLCMYIIAKNLSQPILRLQKNAAKIAAGDLSHRVHIDSVDEIAALAVSFNEMSVALQASFSKLQKTLVAFERFVPSKFISVIAPQGIENIQLGVGMKRNVTILFSDIRGYTSMSEKMTPEEIFVFLNDYLGCMGEAIDKAGGFIDKYIGDAIMALFDDEATDGALNAAIFMQQALDEFNFRRSQKGLPKIAVGIGIHRGEVVMGTVGFTDRIDSTVVGDAVNVASRLEGLTKDYNCEVLVSESVINTLSYPDLFPLKLVDNAVKIRGKYEAIAIYKLEIKKKGRGNA